MKIVTEILQSLLAMLCYNMWLYNWYSEKSSDSIIFVKRT